MYWVNQALEMVDEIEAIKLDDATVFLRRKNADIRARVEEHEAVNKAKREKEEKQTDEKAEEENPQEGIAGDEGLTADLETDEVSESDTVLVIRPRLQ